MKSAFSKTVLYVMLCSVSLSWKCNKHDPETDSPSGNWSVAADFKGDSRSDAAVFVIDNNGSLFSR